MPTVDLQPETDEVLQSEARVDPTGSVCIEYVKTPVRVQELPRKGGVTRTYTVSDTAVKQLIAADHFRGKATIISIGQNMLIGFNQVSTSDPTMMALWPANVPFYVTASVDVYVLCAAAGMTTSISLATELWATGD
jgi:hypothetical protein